MILDFTIVTPSYKYARFIGECLASVACQKGVSFEHLVMDAGSDDGTEKVVAEYPHARFYQEPDKGMSDGINKGFARAKGRWVMWLNADDRLKPGALAAVKQFAVERADADVIYGAWNYVDGEGKFIRRMSLFPFHRRMLVHYGCYIGSTACFYRRATTIERGEVLNVDFHYCMDGEYYARLASKGMRFEYLGRVLADFRLHGESISQRDLAASDLDGVLRHQRQLAEPRTIRRIYGTRLSNSDHINSALDCILYYYYRVNKGLLKWRHARATQECCGDSSPSGKSEG